MWAFLATEVLFFGGMFLGYTVYRVSYPQVFLAASSHTLMLIGSCVGLSFPAALPRRPLHMSSVKHYAQVTIGLLALLLLTVGAAYLHFGAFNTAIAMLISAVKASLIVLFFRHVRQASPLIRLFACAGFFWLALLLALTLSDYLTR